MTAPFLNRTRELLRLARAFDARAPLVTLYGRRRLGKSRLLRESLRGRQGAYYAGDSRDAPVQRAALAAELALELPGFADVHYPNWDALLARLYRDARPGFVLVLDEFPDMVSASPELPSLLRNHIDSSSGAVSVAISGSSQSMMHSLVLDDLQPLYGRSTELLRLGPMSVGWTATALACKAPQAAIEAWAVAGGVPRYWELLRGRPLWDAVAEQILDPNGPLHLEPERLLRDELTDHRRAATLLGIIGAGNHRLSEIASRIGLPSADLSRPLRLLIDVGLVQHEVPFERSHRDTKRTRYDINDPFLRFWFTFVEPNRSQLASGNLTRVLERVQQRFEIYLGSVWEDLARAAVPHLDILGRRHDSASRWWGKSSTEPVELDAVARSEGGELLVAEAKVSVHAGEVDRLLWDLERRALSATELGPAKREVVLFVLRGDAAVFAHPRVIGPNAVIAALGGDEAGWSA